jgi:hypothetical protein
MRLTAVPPPHPPAPHTPVLQNNRAPAIGANPSTRHVVLKRPDGSVFYEGHVLEDGTTYHGRGVRTFSDGGRYDGEWCHGSPHGRGIWTIGDGRRFEGEFVNGYPRGGTQTEADGKRFRVEYDGETNLWDGWGTAGGGPAHSIATTTLTDRLHRFDA